MNSTWMLRWWMGLGACIWIGLSAGCAGLEPVEERAVAVGQPPVAGDPDGAPRGLPEGPEVELSAPSAPGDEGAGGLVEEPGVTRAQLQAFLEKGPSFALTMTRVTPHYEDGQFRGFEIVALHPNARRVLGTELVEGDVVTHINGVRIKQPDDYLSAWKRLNTVGVVEVKILRGGAPETARWAVEGEGAVAGEGR